MQKRFKQSCVLGVLTSSEKLWSCANLRLPSTGSTCKTSVDDRVDSVVTIRYSFPESPARRRATITTEDCLPTGGSNQPRLEELIPRTVQRGGAGPLVGGNLCRRVFMSCHVMSWLPRASFSMARSIRF